MQTLTNQPPNYSQMTPDEQSRVGAFVEMPRGFAKPGYVCKLNKSLYGLKQAPRIWFHHLRDNLLQVGFTQMIDVDPCLFISATVICVTYADDCIMVARDAADIDMVIKSLRELKMTLEEEDELAGFLGIHIERTTDHVKLTQKGLTQRIIEALQIEDLPPVSTPVDKVIGKDPEEVEH